ncbi:MAG: GTP cyclohydrolase II [Alcanivoracaceae bacterium]|nr:GTP cyclohydrolase II [Alcanivoracaceae bacterium]
MSVTFIAKARLPTKYVDFDVHVFMHNEQEHLVLTKGEFNNEDVVLTRVHSECLTGDSLFSLRCDCGPQLEFAMQEMAKQDKALLIYLRQEGRGIGLAEKIKAYQLQDTGVDTYDANLKLGHLADNRDYAMLADVFKYFCIQNIDLMTNNPDKISAIEQAGIHINKRIPIKAGHNLHNQHYLQTKIDKFNHL